MQPTAQLSKSPQPFAVAFPPGEPPQPAPAKRSNSKNALISGMTVIAKRQSNFTGLSTRTLLPLSLTAGLLLPVAPALMLAATLAPSAQAQSTTKTVQGKVFDHGETPLPGSIVYLQDQKTNIVKTFIATADGSYRFGELPADTDYKIWAAYKGDKSKSRLISSFDTKPIVSDDFHVGN